VLTTGFLSSALFLTYISGTLHSPLCLFCLSKRTGSEPLWPGPIATKA
jgi:hypothetical protein